MFLFPARRYRKFVILSSPRSGTHMLRTSLNNHRNIVCLTEMFNPDYTAGKYPFGDDTPEQEILDSHIFSPQERGVRAVGFCLHRTGARFGKWPHLWETLTAMPDLHIVSLHRRNLLRRHLSFHVRPKRAVPKSPLTPLTLDSDQLVADFEHQNATIAAFDRRFHDHPLIRVTYEDLCTNYEATMRDLQRFLNVPYRRLKPETPKLSSRTLPEAIQNYHELKEQFAGTQWAGFFDD